MMPLLRRASRQGNRGGKTGGGGSGGKVKPVKLPETLRVTFLEYTCFSYYRTSQISVSVIKFSHYPELVFDKRFFCTVTVDRLGSDQRWWFASCATCLKSAKYTGYQYRCSDDACSSVEADLTYCISVFASDGTAETEFVLFDKVASGAVGKPLIAILHQRYPGYAAVDKMAKLVRHDVTIPPQITQLIGQKYKLMVSISKKWKLKNGEDLSFQVNRIAETYKPELPPSVSAVASGSGKDALVNNVCGEQLPVLGPAISSGPNTPPPTGFLPGSPAAQAHTHASIGKITPSTPSPRYCSVAPKRGARRSLFGKSLKGKSDVMLGDATTSAQDGVEAVVDDSSMTVEEKDVDAHRSPTIVA
uniref:Replication factor A C-terminal domain-containing protein n=1 Tax=Aegilops tauschii TaxID=37682 RepID=M8CDE6_AEGTA